ncbi:MAG TPA: C4-type zinc ribbon domain-containing protein [Desulfuromonadales bacterium]|nr:C4-type zinc ribbon domain-containing protein [Desulfuromonadales bacterium]
MQEQMRLLIDLQEIDVEINTTREKREKCEEQLSVLREERKQVQEMVESLTRQIEELEADRRQMAQALEQERDNLEKGESRLPTIKTQKEYVAVLKEIDSAKKMIRDVEEQIASKTAEIDSLSGDKEEKEMELETLSEKEAEAREDIKEELEQLEQTLETRTAERENIYRQIKTPLRKRYELLLNRRDGLAVVEAKDGACLGCNMQLPPQLYNSLFHGDDIHTCPQCNRVIYVEDAIKTGS